MSLSAENIKTINKPVNRSLVNDVHSQLNPTFVKTISSVDSVSEIIESIKNAQTEGKNICIAGGRHAMGGQQFLSAGHLLDMTAFNKILAFDHDNGLIKVQSGIMWPDLIAYLQREQQAREKQWTIAQKQTGGDNLSIGGSISANGHGRGLKMQPLIADVQELDLVLHNGQAITCNRANNRGLFSLVIGGYGMFGVIASVTLRLIQRQKLQRTVELSRADEAIEQLEYCRDLGATYGDFQFAIDHQSNDFLNAGILSVYTPVSTKQEPSVNNKLLSAKDWHNLLYLAHTDKTKAFDKYVDHYLATDGQLYWSDTFQLATYLKDYHRTLDKQLQGCSKGTEMITELYVPRKKLGPFMRDASTLLKAAKADVIYGTVRIIETDNDSFMPWAKESYACIVINLHVEHTPYEISTASRTFCDLISLAIDFGGSYFLTYHRFATKQQLLKCYPEMPKFMEYKKHYDPNGVFRSDWFDHYQRLVVGCE